MIKNFFRIACRNISQNKLTTFINVSGLAIGLAASLLILLWVQNELNYENFNINAENIYRVEEDQFYSGEKYHVTVTPFPSGPVWKEKIPEIKEQARINRLPRILFRQGDKMFFESALIAADSTIFRIFTMPFLTGDPETALNAPNSVVLTEKLAEKYFGKDDPLGKPLTLENKIQVNVTGVMKNLPNNSNFTFEAIIPYSLQDELQIQVNSHWGNNSLLTYVLLAKGSDTEAVNKKLTDVVLEYLPQTTTKYMVFPLTDIHLHTQFGYGNNNGPITAVYIFTLIAIFVLLIACINFINLSTARATQRAKEIGIKKVAGAGKMTIFSQFMLESLLQVVAALLLAILFTALLLNTFNTVSGRHFILSDLLQPGFIAGCILTGIFAGLVSGIYPAMFLSSIKPAAILKGETVSRKSRLRQVLVIVQFTLSILIATTAIFMFLQLRFMQNKELGFEKENLICIPMPQNMKPKYEALKKELQREPLVAGVTASTSNPIRIGSNSGGADWEGRDPEKTVLIGVNAIDYDYTKTMRMELVSGRDFSVDYPGDFGRDTTGNFLVNEEVAKLMGTGDPVGKSFRFMGLRGTIVGVMKNFHFKGADQPIEPIAFAITDVRRLNVILIRLSDSNIPAALKAIEKIWRNVVPDYPLDYTFIDQDYDNLFRAQIRLAALLKYFTILAVIIACLGLYGLSLHSAERKTREVGIRKVMGAEPGSIVFTLSKEFLALVIISIIIAVPAGWLIVAKLLKDFAYRIEINSLVFAAISAGAVLIAFLTVSIQAYKSTSVNPAEALKIE